MSASAPTKQDHSTERSSSVHDKWLIAIGVYKLVEATLFVLLGIGAVKLLLRRADLVDVATHFINVLRFNSEGRLVNLILERVAMIDPHRLRQISAVIFGYAALHATEGIGLVLQKAWAEYVTIILTASFLPWEFWEMHRHLTWMKAGVTAVNVLVVVYLVFVVQARIRERRRGARG
ncbi:DUF2127 domain-containing protein [Paracidobacterium acidisoli]|uniref:DUF2127 domain-containing protein n=1 Tax=Paracidobacterium acidisoli TaxID=2303751 RepID=A0A372IKS2_9BACT|nr:DUF2127 domain-containing protein [Paracidobacterium acidisoli]MBT9332940.1 DUF2127 domain-containing protein [Paracidobacterium acidisoli]